MVWSYTGFTNRLKNGFPQNPNDTVVSNGKPMLLPMLNGGVTPRKILRRYPGKFGDMLGVYYNTHRGKYDTKFGAPGFLIDKRYINVYRLEMQKAIQRLELKKNSTLANLNSRKATQSLDILDYE